jgi:oligopeptide/dipeptide ABC transporter ATP-binding protein
MPLLDAHGLNVFYEPRRGPRTWAVREVDIRLDEGEFVGLVGESGCGKSTLGYALTRLLKPPARLESGVITFDGQDIAQLSGEALRRARHGGFALVLQSGMNALNPVRTVEDHFGDVLRAHTSVTHAEIRRRAAELLARVHLPDTTLRRYPHELSGGMRQRVAIALALALEPRLVVFDEPTTALDVIVQHAVMRTIRELQRESGFTAVLISHDLGLVLDSTDRTMIMYAGRVVEDRRSADLLRDARHPYTRALLRCYADPRAEHVDLVSIPGTPPDLARPHEGCLFAPRCERREDACERLLPTLTSLGGGRVACHVAVREARTGTAATGDVTSADVTGEADHGA